MHDGWDDSCAARLTRMYSNGDPRYAAELRRMAEEACRREVAEPVADEEAAIEDLF